MAPRVFLLCILFTVGLLTGRSIGAAGLELSLGFARQPQDVVGVRSRPLTLDCAVTSSLPEVNISWTHDGQPLQLTGDPRRLLLANGSLYIKKVQRKLANPQDTSDEGEYRCIGRNAVGALVSRPAQLRIAGLASNFKEFLPSATTVEIGDVVRFTCQIDSTPSALISWERNEKSLPQNSRILTLDSGDLYLTDVQPTDNGTYRCIATNVVNKKQRISSGGVLSVIAPSSASKREPKFLQPLVPSVQLKQGDELVLPCAVVGPAAPKLTWTRSNTTEQPAVVMNHTAGGVNLLVVHNITLKHAGNYSCTATSPGAKTITYVVRVDVWVLPTFKVNGTPVSEVSPAAKTVRIKCDAQGVPKPEVTWFKDGEWLKPIGRIKQRPSELVLLNGETADSGLYQCVARSKAGESWAAGRLQINSSPFQPEPPNGVTCHTQSSSQVLITWDLPSKPADNEIMAYTVHYQLTDSPSDELQQVIHKDRTFLVDKLLAYTNYTFYVRAYSGRSASDQSTRIVCQTGEGVPQTAPILTLDPTSPTSVRVSWTPLPKELARGPITEYKIQWRRSSHPSTNVDEVKGDVLDYTITGLHPGKTYEIRVLAATKKGWPDLADDQLGWTTLQMPSYETVPHAPVVNLTILNSTCVEVMWSMSAANKYPPAGFKLFYRKQTSQQVGPIVLPANATHYLLNSLEPNTWYEVHVLAFGMAGSGDSDMGVQTIYTQSNTVDVGDTVPSLQRLEPPGNLEAEPTSPTTIRLTWTPPPSDVDVAHYNVSYTPVSQRGGNSSVSYVQAFGTSVEISNLKAYMLYEFKVRTHDHSNQHGPYSQKLECHTKEDMPGAVQDLQLKTVNTSSVRVSWKEPAQTNGIISSYTVAFTHDATLPRDKWKQQTVSGVKLNTEVTGLTPKTHYVLSVRAATHAGLGPETGWLTFNTPASTGDQHEDANSHNSQSDQHLGIVVGVTIGIVCIILCIAIIMWRRHYLQALPQADSGAQHVNGNGYYRDWDHSPTNPQEAELQELEFCVSVTATNIPPANHSLLDTKGGYPNGQANGLKHPLLSNGRVPNGHTTRDRSSVHITENPQVRPSYKCGDVPMERPRPRSSPPQENRLDDKDSGSADHHVPLLRDTRECSIVSGGNEEHDEEEDDDSGVANCTQLTQLDLSNSNAATAIVNQLQPSRE